MNPLRLYFPPHLFSPQVCIQSTCCICLFLSRLLVASRRLCPTVSFPSVRHTLLSVCSFVSASLSGFFISLLMPSYVPIFPLVSRSSLLPSIPVVLTSCPAVEGGRGRGRKGMLILSPQRQSKEGKTEKGKERERENVTRRRK